MEHLGSRAYRRVFNGVLTHLDAEQVHRTSFAALQGVARVPGAITAAERFAASPASLSRTIFGRAVSNPLGLAAGFDKNAEGIDALAGLGFGAIEVGTVTGQPQPGNDRPRLFRLPQDRAILNRMGFNNDGSAVVAHRLALRSARQHRAVLLGINIGKTKAVAAEDTVADYATSARRLAPFADYLVINVSSPNTPGLRDLQAVTELEPIVDAVLNAADDASAAPVPVLVKIAPDLADDDIAAVADLVRESGLAGVVATNTTISREGLLTDPNTLAALGAGGISGPVLAPRAEQVLEQLRQLLPAESVVISVGGVHSAEDIVRRLRLGADLVQAYTGLIYGGPTWVRETLHDLARLLNPSAGPTNHPQEGTG